MFTNEYLNRLGRFLTKSEGKFLKQLCYWSFNPKGYGVNLDGKTWIYNTLEDWADQLEISKSSVRRTIKSLKDKNFILSRYLSPNKRNRTLYYAANGDEIENFLFSKINKTCVQKNKKIEHMDEHMNIDNNKQIDKSHKSKILIKNDFEDQRKTTTVQDMTAVWKKEFPDKPIILNKNLARYLVAVFKEKFNSSTEAWKRYLKTLKTSAYLMNEKFKLSLWWVIKFSTVDRIRAGELGVDEQKISTDESEIFEKAVSHIRSVNESAKCKKIREKIMQALSPAIYLSWFTKIKLTERDGDKIFSETDNCFVRNYIETNFSDRIKQFGLVCV